MPLPRMLLTASATMLQRPIARTSSGCVVRGGSCVIARAPLNLRQSVQRCIEQVLIAKVGLVPGPLSLDRLQPRR